MSEPLLFAEHVLPRFELGIFMYWTCDSMNNLLSFCALVNARIRASDKDLPVTNQSDSQFKPHDLLVISDYNTFGLSIEIMEFEW